jgi:hypothetical protein
MEEALAMHSRRYHVHGRFCSNLTETSLYVLPSIDPGTAHFAGLKRGIILMAALGVPFLMVAAAAPAARPFWDFGKFESSESARLLAAAPKSQSSPLFHEDGAH